MKIVGFIAEYNPFHFGHKYHLEESKFKSNSTHSIAIMSSSFVQRGEPAFVDKWTRGKMAVENGVDLVLELPFAYSVQSAELFAQGGVSILNSLNCVDYISFGSEWRDIEDLKKISDILVKEPYQYKNILKENLNKGLSFPKSRNIAIKSFFHNENKIDNILNKSNNILAIEYLKALKRANSNIKPLAIKRKGSDYKDTKINNIYSSATAIRENILKSGLPSVKDLLPPSSYRLMIEYKSLYENFNIISNYKDILRYLVLTRDKNYLKQLFDMEQGLENRIVEKFKINKNLNQIIEDISSKRHTKTRISRILIHLLNRLDRDTINNLYTKDPNYIRILAANQKGLEIINRIKKSSDISIINRFSGYKEYEDKYINKFLELEEKATDIYFLGLKNHKDFKKMDYITSPYIKK